MDISGAVGGGIPVVVAPEGADARQGEIVLGRTEEDRVGPVITAYSLIALENLPGDSPAGRIRLGGHGRLVQHRRLRGDGGRLCSGSTGFGRVFCRAAGDQHCDQKKEQGYAIQSQCQRIQRPLFASAGFGFHLLQILHMVIGPKTGKGQCQQTKQDDHSGQCACAGSAAGKRKAHSCRKGQAN